MKLFFFFLLLAFNYSLAQLSPFEINGYAKYLFSSTKYNSAPEKYDDHLIHARINTRWYPSENLKAVMEMRLRAYYGESIENINNFSELIKGKYDYLNLDELFWESKKSIGYGEIDRLYLDWNYSKIQLTLGRQRIAWGTSWTWNPTDIFNPLSVLDFDYEERPAVDAVRAQYYTGPVSKIELAYKPAKEKEKIVAAGLFSMNFFDYDFNFMGGIKNNRWFGGGGWVGDISGAGFRGEIFITKGKRVELQVPGYYFGSNDVIYSFVLSGDYTFPSSLYIHTEILHNSIGVRDLTAIYQQQAFNSGMLSAARWSIYQEFSYDFHPLIRGTLFGIYNPDDKSTVIVPSLSYSVITNLDLLLLVMFFKGDPLTEYGNYGNSLFMRLKYSF